MFYNIGAIDILKFYEVLFETFPTTQQKMRKNNSKLNFTTNHRAS